PLKFFQHLIYYVSLCLTVYLIGDTINEENLCFRIKSPGNSDTLPLPTGYRATLSSHILESTFLKIFYVLCQICLLQHMIKFVILIWFSHTDIFSDRLL